ERLFGGSACGGGFQMRRAVLLGLSLFVAVYAQKAPKQTVVKAQKTSMTRDQEVQLGKEAASQVEREMEVVNNPEIEGWLKQIGQQQTLGTVFGLAGAAVGMVTTGSNGECGMLCQLGQTGMGIGGNSLLMKFSRGYERDADLNGARMLASSNYDPIGLPTFFE